MTVTVAIVSDTHSHLDERIADIVRDCDYAIHAGDICGEDVIDSMQPKTGKVIAVSGNNDPHCHESELPWVSELQLPGGKVSVEHGHFHGMHEPCHDSLRKAHGGSRMVVYGHTHKLTRDMSAMPWVVNPGAAGVVRNHGGPSCLILKATEQDWLVEEHRFTEQ